MNDFVNRIALGSMQLMPTQIARHLLFLLRSNPEVCERLGYHIRPIHYYEPIPDFRQITSERLVRRRDFPTIDFNWSAQLSLINILSEKYQQDLEEVDNCP